MERLQNIKLAQLLLCMLSLVLSFVWLIPNHYPPWTSFHSDTLVAVVLLLAGAIVVLTYPNKLKWSVLPIWILTICLLPLLQLQTGLLYFSSEAFVAFLYIFGFAIVVLLGQYWSVSRPDEPENFLLFAVGLAAIVSVGIQLCQLLGLHFFDIWVLDVPTKPSGNLSQTNQMATFLVWGVVSIAWAYERKHIGATVAFTALLYLLSGVAMTQSRTSWLELLAIGFLYAVGPFKVSRKKRIAVSTALGAYFVAFSSSLPYLMDKLDYSLDYTLRSAGLHEARLYIWRGLIDAALERPWWGYGFRNITEAAFQAASADAKFVWLVGHSHNLILDFMIWFGLPAALVITAVLVSWLWKCFRLSINSKQYIHMMLLLAVGIHAMLELPLHYAYFLLPAGLVAGSLDSSINVSLKHAAGKVYIAIALLAAMVALAVVMVDYLRFENTYRIFRLQNTELGKAIKYEPPETLVLSHWREMIPLIRRDASAPLDAEGLELMRQMTYVAPAQIMFLKYAIALTQQGNFHEASRQLRVSCKISLPTECRNLILGWKSIAKETVGFERVDISWSIIKP